MTWILSVRCKMQTKHRFASHPQQKKGITVMLFGDLFFVLLVTAPHCSEGVNFSNILKWVKIHQITLCSSHICIYAVSYVHLLWYSSQVCLFSFESGSESETFIEPWGNCLLWWQRHGETQRQVHIDNTKYKVPTNPIKTAENTQLEIHYATQIVTSNLLNFTLPIHSIHLRCIV